MRAIWVLSIFIFITLSCSDLTVKKDYSSEYDFYGLETYSFKDDGVAPLDPNSLIGQRVIEFVDKELQKKGYRKVEVERGDFIVSIGYWDKEIVTPPSSTVGIGYGRTSGLGFGGLSVGHTVGSTQELETLQVRMFDSKTSKEIWKGRVTGGLEYDNPEKTTAKLEKAVAKVIGEFFENVKLSE